MFSLSSFSFFFRISLKSSSSFSRKDVVCSYNLSLLFQSKVVLELTLAFHFFAIFCLCESIIKIADPASTVSFASNKISETYPIS